MGISPVLRVVFLIVNEQTKLTATWLSALATALVAAGVFAPGAALIYRLTPVEIGIGYVIAVACGCFAFGLLLHILARLTLRRLRQ